MWVLILACDGCGAELARDRSDSRTTLYVLPKFLSDRCPARRFKADRSTHFYCEACERLMFPSADCNPSPARDGAAP